MNTNIDLLNTLSPEKRALLEMRLRKKAPSLGASPQVTPHSTEGPLPLSFAQESLWFLNQLYPGNPFYNLPEANLRLHGRVNVAALRRALHTIIERHQTLRANFISVGGKPMQIIAPSTGFDLNVVDLSHLPKCEAVLQMEQWLDRESLRPFDLTKDFKLRPTLLRLAEDDHLLILMLHHIVADVWSIGVLFQELGMLYEAFCQGRPSPLPPLPVQYTDFAICQRERFQGDAARRQLDYWKNELNGAASVLDLPTDRPGSNPSSLRGKQRFFRYEPKLLADLKELGRRENMTLFTILLGAFQTLLHRYARQDDILVGAPIGARKDARAEQLIGLFLNAVVFRSDFSREPTFLELLQQVRGKVLGAFANMELPVEQVIEELRIPRSAGRNPLFQVLFQHLPSPPRPRNLGDLAVELLPPAETYTAKFDLTLNLEESSQGLEANLEYSTELFDEATIDRFLGHYQMLLEAIISNPAQRVSQLPLLTPREEHQLLVEWNEAKTADGATTVPAVFEKQAAKTPEAVAVIFQGRRLTYRQLNERANQLAHFLIRYGIGPETVVAVCMERSVEMVIAVLGIHKAGGAYTPLDPENPADRLAFMLEDTSAPILLTQEKFKEIIPGRTGAKTICVDGSWNQIAHEPTANPSTALQPQNLAYILYTSGSTGRPKGVMITQDSLCCHAAWMQRHFPLAAEDRVLQRAAFSFDVSVWEIFGPLLHGAQLVMAAPGIHRDSAALAKTIAEEGITLLQIVPSQLRALLNEPELKSCTALKWVIAGGEVLPPDLIARFYAISQARLFNSYGPTEATIDATWRICSPQDANQASIPLGNPVDQTSVYILDKSLQPAPIGVPGELHLGGRSLARGYWRRPELTEEKFIPHPFSSEPGARLYKTGDLVRYLPNGEIAFLGRVDHQVKLRGFRIELEEIEAVLRQQPHVREAVVALKDDPSGGKRLVAYVVPGKTAELKTKDLRHRLKRLLPEYMVPGVFVVLESLPLLANGKVNRQALPEPEMRAAQEQFVPPGNSMEQAVAKIWCDVLGLPRVSIHDDFFELGGHSLLATQVLSRVRDLSQKEINLRDLFEFPTIAGLCAAIENAGRNNLSASQPTLVALGRKPSLLHKMQMLCFSAPAMEHAALVGLL